MKDLGKFSVDSVWIEGCLEILLLALELVNRQVKHRISIGDIKVKEKQKIFVIQ